MSRALVVSYSLSGTTRRVAREIADALSAETCEIEDAKPRTGVVGYLQSGLESVAKGLPSIRASCDPGAYDLVVLGTPVWSGTMASPMRSFLFAHRGQLTRIGCFCTMGGRGAEGTLREMKVLCGALDAPTFYATEADVHAGRHRQRLRELITSLERLGGPTSVAAE